MMLMLIDLEGGVEGEGTLSGSRRRSLIWNGGTGQVPPQSSCYP